MSPASRSGSEARSYGESSGLVSWLDFWVSALYDCRLPFSREGGVSGPRAVRGVSRAVFLPKTAKWSVRRIQ